MRLNEQEVETAVAAYAAARGIPVRLGLEADLLTEQVAGSSVILGRTARSTVGKLNRHLPAPTINAVVATLSHPQHPTLIENNRHFHGLLTHGVSVRVTLAAPQAYLLQRLLSGQVRVSAVEDNA